MTLSETIILPIVIEKLGIKSNVRDTYLTAIINGIIAELEDEKGLVLNSTDPYHLLFIVDYVCWRYQAKDESGAMPRHLQYRLHNFMLHNGRPTV